MGLALIVLALAQTPLQVLPEAKRLAQECGTAFQTKDKTWFERRMTASFVYQDLEGETKDRAEALERIEGWFHPLGYRVSLSLALVSARKTKDGLRIVGDLKVRTQFLGWRRMPLTETTIRVESWWRHPEKEWLVDRLVERGKSKTVDGHRS